MMSYDPPGFRVPANEKGGGFRNPPRLWTVNDGR